MYYLTKFCRICVKTGVELTDIDKPDIDSVKFSEKLEICMKMVINKESLSTQICLQCIEKLRISYNFQKLFQQSTKILEGYLSELISSTTQKLTPENFVNSELRVTLSPLRKQIKRKRISKEQRCSLLKKLLLDKNNGVTSNKRVRGKKKRGVKGNAAKGGLRDIIDFTKNYDFGYKIDKNHNYSTAPLAKLINFTNSFFLDNFADFRNTILYIIENKDSLYESDDDEEMFNKVPEDECPVKFEEVVVEPDIKIKSEIDFDDCEPYSCNYYVETSYSDSECKAESSLGPQNCHLGSPQYIPQPQESSMQMLDKLVGSWNQRRTFSPYSVRCRTRGNPYINPELKQQFQLRSFQCSKCNRYFKSPGYLKAHISKVHH